MKGIIYNLLEDAVIHQHGERAWLALLDDARLSGDYSSLGLYPDADIVALVDSASRMLGTSEAEVLRWFGRAAMPRLAEAHGEFFLPHHSLRPFLLSLNDVIHPEVHKLHPGARCPHFEFHALADGGLAILYRSQRKLCQLAHGMIEGAAAIFDEPVQIHHSSCMLRGDPACRMALSWQEVAGKAA